MATSARHAPAVLAVFAVLGVLAGPAAAGGPTAASGPGGGNGAADPVVSHGPSVDVVVVFQEQPASRVASGSGLREDVVHAYGGVVTETFDVLPAVAATVPAGAVPVLSSHPAVAIVERDEPVRLGGAVSAPRAAADATGDPGANETVPWGVRRVQADAVHDDGTNGNGVVVAVLDSGVDGDHPDLVDSYVGGVDVVANGSDPADAHGHGTFVAGVVAGADDGSGVVGVAPGVSIFDVRVLNGSLVGTPSDLVAGVERAVEGPDGEVGTDDDADVILMSLASFVGPESLKAALDAAYEEHGVVVVAAAGNTGELDYPDTVTFPGRYAEVVAVGAVDREDERPSWSGAGPHLELVAPGVSVRSTARGGGYVRLDGTSVAAPHVAGVAALVLDSRVPPVADHDGDGDWGALEVRERLRLTARDLGPEGPDDDFGHGLVDALAATGEPRANEPPTVDVVAPADGDAVGDVVVRVNASDAESLDRRLVVEVTVDGTHVGEARYNETTGHFELPVAVAALAAGEDGDEAEVSVTVTDAAGDTAEATVTVTVDGEG